MWMRCGHCCGIFSTILCRLSLLVCLATAACGGMENYTSYDCPDEEIDVCRMLDSPDKSSSHWHKIQDPSQDDIDNDVDAIVRGIERARENGTMTGRYVAPSANPILFNYYLNR